MIVKVNMQQMRLIVGVDRWGQPVEMAIDLRVEYEESSVHERSIIVFPRLLEASHSQGSSASHIAPVMFALFRFLIRCEQQLVIPSKGWLWK